MPQPEILLPHDDQLEREILGCCFAEDPGVLANVRSILDASEFYVAQHQRVYRSLCRIAERGDPLTWTGVHAEMQTQIPPQQITLSELIEFSAANVAYAIDKLLKRAKDLARRRALIWQAHEVMHRAADVNFPLDDVASSASQALKEAASDSGGDSAEDICGIITEVGGIGAFLKPKMGIPTPWTALNYCLGGWQKGDLILIGARPSMGKTALMLNAVYGAARNGTPAVVYSYEMSRESLIMRLVSMLTGITFLDLQRGETNASERHLISQVIDHLGEIPLRIKQASGKTALAIRVHAERLHHKGLLELAAVDYIGLMRSGGRFDSRNHELGETCRQLKETAADLQVPFIVLSQLSRAPENRPDKRPGMSDLRDSGDLESHADVIGMLHRPGYYNREDEALRNAAELIIAKQRNGDTPIIPLCFRRESGKFESDSREVKAA